MSVTQAIITLVVFIIVSGIMCGLSESFRFVALFVAAVCGIALAGYLFGQGFILVITAVQTLLVAAGI